MHGRTAAVVRLRPSSWAVSARAPCPVWATQVSSRTREKKTHLSFAFAARRWLCVPPTPCTLHPARTAFCLPSCAPTAHTSGISAAVHGRPASMLITDLNAETMANLAYNIELNRHQYPAGSEVRAAAVHGPVSLEKNGNTCVVELSPVMVRTQFQVPRVNLGPTGARIAFRTESCGV